MKSRGGKASPSRTEENDMTTIYFEDVDQGSVEAIVDTDKKTTTYIIDGWETEVQPFGEMSAQEEIFFVMSQGFVETIK